MDHAKKADIYIVYRKQLSEAARRNRTAAHRKTHFIRARPRLEILNVGVDGLLGVAMYQSLILLAFPFG
jgi:hypothetical protein